MKKTYKGNIYYKHIILAKTIVTIIIIIALLLNIIKNMPNIALNVTKIILNEQGYC